MDEVFPPEIQAIRDGVFSYLKIEIEPDRELGHLTYSSTTIAAHEKAEEAEWDHFRV